MPASRSALAMILAPRSWPSRPTLATTTRSRPDVLVWITSALLVDRGLAVSAENVLQRGDDLALGSAGAGAVEQRRHEVAVRVGGHLAQLAQHAVDRGGVAGAAQAAHAIDLLALELRVDMQDLDRLL